MFGNYTLTKGWGLQFFSFYRGRQVQLQGSQGGFYAYSVAVKKDIAKKKGSIGLGIENFFSPAIRVRSELASPVIVQNSVNEFHNMSIRVNVSYRIGKLSFDAPRRRNKSVSNDDLKDGGGGDAGGQQAATPAGGGQAQGGGQRPGGNAPVTIAKAIAPVDLTQIVNAEGNWTYTVDSPQGGAGKLAIKKNGDTYSGTITNNRNNKETPLSSVIVKGNEITLTYDVSFGGNTMNMLVKAIIKDDELNGNMSVGQFGAFPIKGKREK
jgi:hypothetical protein